MRRPLLLALAVLMLSALGALLLVAAGWTPPEAADEPDAPDGNPAIARAVLPAPATSTESGTTANAPAGPERTPVATTAAAERVRVRVVDADRKPIADAEIETFSDSAPGVVRTDADGLAWLPRHPSDGGRRMLVRADLRHLQAYWQERDDLTITLPWTGPLTARVVDRTTGTPVAGVRITRAHHHCKRCEPDQASADAGGTFTLAAVPRDEDCVFVFEAEGYPRQYERLRLPGTGAPIAHTFALVRGVVVAGRCVDLATRQPVAGVRVLLEGDALATSDDRGAFRVLVHDRDGDGVGLRFEHAGHCDVTFRIATPQLDPTTEFPLPRSVSLAGRVVTPDGVPIAAARVDAITLADPALPGMPAGARVAPEDYAMTDASDDQGRFAIAGLKPRGRYQLRASHPEHKRTDPAGSIVELAEGAAPITLVLVPKPRLPPTGSVVGTFQANGGPSGGRWSWQQGEHRGDGTIEPDGTFVMERVPAGRVHLVLLPTPFANSGEEVRQAAAWRADVEVAVGATTRLEVVHTFVDAGITGRVTFPDGSPAAGQRVWARSQYERFLATVGDDGRYELRVPAADIRLRVGCGPAAQTRSDVAPGATGIDFVVPRPGTLRLRLRKPDGSHADSAIGQVMGGHVERRLAPAPDPEGFVALPLDEGTHALAFACPGHAPELRTVSVDGASTLEVTFAPGVEALLRLRPGTLPPPANLRLQVVDAVFADLPPAATIQFGDTRHVEITGEGTLVGGLSRGTHRLVPQDPAIEIEPSTFTTGAAPVTVDITWRRKQPAPPASGR